MFNDYDQVKIFQLIKKGKFNEKNCFEWQGSVDKNGYGITTYVEGNEKRKSWRVHRLMYFLLKKEFNENLFICHACDNPRCFNINHLFMGSGKDNSQDRERKGRSKSHFKCGKDNINCKLNEVTVLNIRKLYSEGVRIRDLVKIFNLKQPTISKIVHRIDWKNI